MFTANVSFHCAETYLSVADMQLVFLVTSKVNVGEKALIKL